MSHLCEALKVSVSRDITVRTIELVVDGTIECRSGDRYIDVVVCVDADADLDHHMSWTFRGRRLRRDGQPEARFGLFGGVRSEMVDCLAEVVAAHLASTA